MAAAVAALAVFAGLGVLVAGKGVLGVDEAGFDVIDPLRGETGLDVVRILTDVGSLPVAALVIVAAAVYASRTVGSATAIGLVVGLAVLFVLVHLGKDITDRPRPESRFYDPAGASYPSGHAAYATAWLAAATLTGRRALIVVAALIVIAVGASRLYLHVHHLTDVVGGFALGAAVFLPVLARR